MKELFDMKKGNQKKVTSVRLNDEEKQIVAENTKAKRMTTSSYIRDRVLHDEKGLTLETMIQMQNLVNEAFETIKYADPDKAISMEMKVNELWTSLK